MNSFPHEIAICGVFLPPLLIAASIGLFATMLTTKQLNKYKLSQYFFYPPLVSLGFLVIYTVIIGTFIFRI